MDKDRRLEIALFRYQIIAPALDPDLKRGEKTRILRQKAQKLYDHPTQGKRRYKFEALRKWCKRYRKGGLDALLPKDRSDKGKSKALSPAIITKACDLKLELPSRPISSIIDILERCGDVAQGVVKPSTLARVLASKGLSGRTLKEKQAFRRYMAEFPNDTWQSDQYSGPYVPDCQNPDKKVKTQLFVFLDDSSRLLCHGQFYLDGSLLSLEDCFRKAVLRRGLPKRVYFDNGKVYSSSQMRSTCAYLGIQPVYAQPYSPEGKGKVERFLGYVESNFIPELKRHPAKGLDELNQLFFAWVERRYNRKVHSEIGKTPLDAWMEHMDKIRFASDDEIRKAFLFKEERAVGKARTIKLLGKYYEVLAILAGKKVEVRYDPQDLSSVLIFYQGDFFQKAYPLKPGPDVGKKVKLDEDQSKDTGVNYLQTLLRDHKEAQKTELAGLSLIRRPSDSRFTLLDLLSLLGKKGLSLSSYDKEHIQHSFDTFGPFDKDLAEKAVELAIELKGKGQHISFYLDRIVKIHKETRR